MRIPILFLALAAFALPSSARAQQQSAPAEGEAITIPWLPAAVPSNTGAEPSSTQRPLIEPSLTALSPPTRAAAVPVMAGFKAQCRMLAFPISCAEHRRWVRHLLWGAGIGGGIGLGYGLLHPNNSGFLELTPMIETVLGAGIGGYAGTGVYLLRSLR